MMNPEFLQISEKLKFAMEKQIAILREMLTNLQQEQHLLYQRMMDSLPSIYQSRELLHGELKGIKKERLSHEKELGKQNPASIFEIATLRSQIDILTKKMRLQKDLNVKLALQSKTLEKAEKSGLILPTLKKKPKIEVATELEP